VTNKNKIIFKSVITVIAILLIISNFVIDNPDKREKKAVKLLTVNQAVYLKYLREFMKYDTIISISYSKDRWVFNYYPYNRDDRDVKLFKTLIINEKENKYFNYEDINFESLEEALSSIELTKKELNYWKKFFSSYNFHSISSPIFENFVILTIDRFHIVPHGYMYIPKVNEHHWIYNEIPGKLRGNKNSNYNIITHIKGNWFYFDG